MTEIFPAGISGELFQVALVCSSITTKQHHYHGNNIYQNNHNTIAKITVTIMEVNYLSSVKNTR